MGDSQKLNFADWEKAIRSGRGGAVRDFISAAQNEKLSRAENLKLANMARRVGLASLALKLLRPIVRPEAGLKSKATPDEKAEYGSALAREGLISEALKILQEVKVEDYPEAHLYRAFALFNRWDYESAVPLLRSYLPLAQNEYQRIIGKINLVAALVFTEQVVEAGVLLKELLAQTDSEDYKLSHAFCLELSGQCELELKNFDKARQYFKKAAQFTAQSATSTPFLVRKWLALVDLIEEKNSAAVNQVHQIKTEASAISDWETVRTCDLHLAVAGQDQALAESVYFGTPHRKFREKIKNKISTFTDIPEFYDRVYNSEENSSKQNLRIFDMHEGREIGTKNFLKPGQTLHRLYRVVAFDFYRPIRATEIFSLVFQNEYFDPAVSINRVHQAIKRLRDWLAEGDMPVDIIENNNSYSVRSEEPYIIRWANRDFIYDEDSQINKLFNSFSREHFSVKQAAAALTMSERSASRLIKDAVESGKLLRIGAGSKTQYRFVN